MRHYFDIRYDIIPLKYLWANLNRCHYDNGIAMYAATRVPMQKSRHLFVHIVPNMCMLLLEQEQ
jgi:hypothetical protein